MPNPTAESLKAEAETYLTKLLKQHNSILSGDARKLAVLAMGSFACEIVIREVNKIFEEEPV